MLLLAAVLRQEVRTVDWLELWQVLWLRGKAKLATATTRMTTIGEIIAPALDDRHCQWIQLPVFVGKAWSASIFV